MSFVQEMIAISNFFKEFVPINILYLVHCTLQNILGLLKRR